MATNNKMNAELKIRCFLEEKELLKKVPMKSVSA